MSQQGPAAHGYQIRVTRTAAYQRDAGRMLLVVDRRDRRRAVEDGSYQVPGPCRASMITRGEHPERQRTVATAGRRDGGTAARVIGADAEDT
ncbi:hypothetical protein GOEFS_075_00640 [Gordonia effusa NBRC 100432]|uniref:Uncharacterized protein n=1 Tax=Gordonia effusa NBRC 100432 TaxID=1077974 RepID=H0R238_9ACTN|nr:hypothetical protein GOEFS_075_00640 [Gordonia effusa NBRC 100432]